MRTSTITIPAPAAWINSNHRIHRMAEAKLTAAWRQAADLQVSAYHWEPYTEPVHITAHIWKPRNGRYDPNNLWPTVKAIVDGFVQAGFLIDDDYLHVIGPDMRHGGKGPAAVILTIKDVSDSFVKPLPNTETIP